MADIKNNLTWSFSRDRLFKDCRRAYFFNYYLSWGGWDKDAPDNIRKAYILKNIRTVDAWVGDLVHQLIKWIIENRLSSKDIAFDEAKDKAKTILLKTWEQSRAQLWKNDVKNNLNLYEHYYNIEYTQDQLKEKLSKVVNSLLNIYQSGFIKFLASLSKDNFLTIDELDSFEFLGVKMFAIPDFAFKKDGLFFLYDWKTGKPYEKDIFQLSFYMLYAQYKWKADIKDMRIVPVYLTQDSISFSPITPVSIDEVKTYAKSSLQDMKAVLISEDKADEKLCPKTTELWRCKNCKFKEICL